MTCPHVHRRRGHRVCMGNPGAGWIRAALVQTIRPGMQFSRHFESTMVWTSLLCTKLITTRTPATIWNHPVWRHLNYWPIQLYINRDPLIKDQIIILSFPWHAVHCRPPFLLGFAGIDHIARRLARLSRGKTLWSDLLWMSVHRRACISYGVAAD